MSRVAVAVLMGCVALDTGVHAAPSAISAPRSRSPAPSSDTSGMFKLKLPGAPKERGCVELNQLQGTFLGWTNCDKPHPNYPAAIWSMKATEDSKVQLVEQHFPKDSPMCLTVDPTVNRNHEYDYLDLIVLDDCRDGDENQHWKFDTKTGYITSISAKYAGQCLVQGYEDPSGPNPWLDLVPCDKADPTLAKFTLDHKDATPKPKEYGDELPVPEGAFVISFPGMPAKDRCVLLDREGGSLGTANCFTAYSDSPLAVWLMEKTPEGNVQLREQHYTETAQCLTIAPSYSDPRVDTVRIEDCRKGDLAQQWVHDADSSGRIRSADPKKGDVCLAMVKESDNYDLEIASCSKAGKASTQTKLMYDNVHVVPVERE